MAKESSSKRCTMPCTSYHDTSSFVRRLTRSRARAYIAPAGDGPHIKTEFVFGAEYITLVIF